MEYEGEGMAMMASMMPSGMIFQFRGEDITYEMTGGMMASIMGKFIFQGKKGEMYMVKESEKVAYQFSEEMLKEGQEKAEDNKPKVTALDETAELLGYSCKKFKVVSKGQDDAPITQYIWATEDLKIRQPKSSMGEAAGISQFAMQEMGVQGFPLRVETHTTAAGIDMTMLMVAKEIDANKPDKKEFTFGSDYEVKEFDPSNMMGN